MAKLTDEDGDPIPIDPADLPPALLWEQGVYQIYQRCRTQWTYTMGGRAGLNYALPTQLAQMRGYDMELFLELLQVIEWREMHHDASAREQEQVRRERQKAH